MERYVKWFFDADVLDAVETDWAAKKSAARQRGEKPPTRSAVISAALREHFLHSAQEQRPGPKVAATLKGLADRLDKAAEQLMALAEGW